MMLFIFYFFLSWGAVLVFHKVCVILEGGGGCAEFIAVPRFHVLPIPYGVSLTAAASLPQASCLTLYALSMLTNIAPGKTILVLPFLKTKFDNFMLKL